MKTLRLFLFIISLVFAENVAAQTVYVTKSGEKYHTANCRYLKYSKKELKIKEAIDLGYVACKVCKPTSKKGKIINSTSNSLSSSSNQNTTPPKKATATQCTGKTKSGARCKRKTKNVNGRCYQH